LVHRVLTHNSMRKGVQLLHRRIEDIEVVEVSIAFPLISIPHMPYIRALMNALYGNLRLTVSTAAPEIRSVAACGDKLCCLPTEPVYLSALFGPRRGYEQGTQLMRSCAQNPGAQQLGLGTPQRGSFLEEARRATLASRADVYVLVFSLLSRNE